MHRTTCLILAMLIAAASPSLSSDQAIEKMNRNIRVRDLIAGCTEGFAEALEGLAMTYGSFRPEPLPALITRATTGSMAIAWLSAPAPPSTPGSQVSFVVMAGMYGRMPSGYRFRMTVNDIPRFEFRTTPQEDWAVAGEGGGELRFIGVSKDKHGDIFGCLRITLPEGWVRAGERVRFRIVGEKAEKSVWFMVFEASDVGPYQKALVENEFSADFQFRSEGSHQVVTVLCPPPWCRKELRLTFGRGQAHARLVEPCNGFTRVVFIIGREQPAAPLKVELDGSVVMQIDTLFLPITTALLYPQKLITLSAAAPESTGWTLSCHSTYHPGLGSSLLGLSRISSGRGTQHLIISTHQDIGWMDSPANCIRDRDEKIITPLLNIMKTNPAYRFDLEDVLCLREYLDRHPDRKEEIHGYMRAGRLGVGASFNQPYEDLCSAEMLVRQFHAGKRWLRSQFPGCDSRTYWNPDIPGRTLQMPQVLAKSDVPYLVMSRFEKGLYSWLSPGGSSVLAYSPGHYGDFKARVEGADFEKAAGYVASTASAWLKATREVSAEIPLLSMSDMSGPDTFDTFLSQWTTLRKVMNPNGSVSPLFLPPLRYSRVEEYLTVVAPARDRLPEIRGERPNIWLYIHGPTHHHAISAKREADILLTAAEIFNTADALLAHSFAAYPQAELTAAWEAQLYPDHGWGGKNGEITDSTFRAKFETARDVSQRLLFRSLGSIASRITTKAASGMPVVVFNPLLWKRSGPIRITAQLDAGAAKDGLALFDARGTSIPIQVDSMRRHPDGSIAAAGIQFVAHGVPSVGYATYYLRPSRTRPPQAVQPRECTILENTQYRVMLGPGGIHQIFDKHLNRTLFDTAAFLGGELFTMQSIGEDAGEWGEPQQPTMEGFDKLSNHPAAWHAVESGPVREVAEAKYTLAQTTVVQRVILFNALKRIDVEVSLLGWNGTRYREFRLAFPIHADQGRVTYEVPFGALEVGKSEMQGSAGERYTQTVAKVRPRSIQNWIDLSSPQAGVTLTSSVAVWDFLDPTNPDSGTLLLQPILLASRRSCHGAGPWYLQEGDHHYRFTLTSHTGGWQSGQRQALEANTPLYAVQRTTANGAAGLATSGSFLAQEGDGLILSTMKKCDDDGTVIVRTYENCGQSVSSRLVLQAPVTGAQETNLLEDEGATLPSTENRITIHAGPHEISTVKIKPAF